MSPAVGAALPLSLAVLLGGAAHATPPLVRDSESMSFRCNLSEARMLTECYGRENGLCPNSSSCFMREGYETGDVIASCCCDRSSTPIEEVRHGTNWSCWVRKRDSEDARGGRPFCDIHCCKKPQVSRACFGNGPICCDGRYAQCGVNARNGACCAPKLISRVRDPHCSAAVGHTCGWVRTSWLTLLMPSSQCRVGSQANCHEHCELVSRGLLVTAVGAIVAFYTAYNWLEEGMTGRTLRHVVPLVVAVGLVLLSARWAGHAWGMCLLWAVCWLVLALLPALLRHRAALMERLFPQQPRQEGQSSRAGDVWLAVLVNLEDYELWQRVEDKSMEDLKKKLTERGWTVPPIYRNPKREGFDSLVGDVGNVIEDSEDARVLIFVSCHSQMVFGDPQMLPVEAGMCWRKGISIYSFMYQLGRLKATRPHFAIFVNGCLSGVSCWQKLCLGTARLSDDRIPKNTEAVFSALFASEPGRNAYGNQLTQKVLAFLEGPPSTDDHLQRLFDYVQQQRPRGQRPFLMTNAHATSFRLTPAQRNSRSSLSPRGKSRSSLSQPSTACGDEPAARPGSEGLLGAPALSLALT